MAHPNDIADRSARESARALLALLKKGGPAVAVPPRGEIVEAVVALLRVAAEDEENRLSIVMRGRTIIVRFNLSIDQP
jgi:hypothetical protein